MSDLRSALARTKIPPRMWDGIVRYVMHGCSPGHFLTAVVTNDLKSAVMRADDENKLLLWDYVSFFYNHTPTSCWGSQQAFLNWIDKRGWEGSEAIPTAYPMEDDPE